MSFLKAEWRKLAIANYAVNPSILEPHLPFGTELDLWEGQCFVSLVGFRFINTKILGIKIPFHTNFEEVNLRFYVKRLENNEWKRGVVFIKEIVPRHAITLVANTIYKEHYETMRMDHLWGENDLSRIVQYKWKKNKKWHSIHIEASLESIPLVAKSETEFITEHYWGYARVSASKTNEYEVTHPRWNTYEVNNSSIDVDFGAVYGEEFSSLNDMQPTSVMLAEGSEITVEKNRTII
ncbi:MAG: DUF2071 domain-containing protein [Flavobacteriales bacterium]|nr:DUF2071 domain-containing protein [Flavobacteriales bacterium]